MRVLGLDASTTTIGIAVIDYDINYKCKLIHHEYYKPNKKDGLLNMLIEARSYILKIGSRFKIDEFVIEDYAKFMKGKSSAQTIIPLSILNVTLRLGIQEVLGIQPNALNVLKIRHAIKHEKKPPAKEDIPEVVAKHLGIDFPYLYRVNRKKEEVIKDESYDIADAIAVALAWVKLKSRPVKKASSRKKKK